MVYYAVAKGRCPGIYRKREECLAQIHGFPENAYRKRFCYDDAKRFSTRQGIRPQYDCGNFGDNIDKTKHFYYAVAIGRNPGIYHTSWTGCKDEVMYFSGRVRRVKYFLIVYSYRKLSYQSRKYIIDEVLHVSLPRYPEYSDDEL